MSQKSLLQIPPLRGLVRGMRELHTHASDGSAVRSLSHDAAESLTKSTCRSRSAQNWSTCGVAPEG